MPSSPLNTSALDYSGGGGVGARSMLPGAVGGSVTISGMAELAAKLALIENDLTAGRGADAALRAAALPIQNEWKRQAPYRTGTYRKSIHTEMLREGGEVTAVIGTDIIDPPYPAYLEFGTSRMAPRPSMRPAFDNAKDEALQAFGDAVAQVLRKYGGI